MDVTRRGFMKAASTTAGVMIATGWSPLAYAQNEKVRLAIIGAGSQNRFHIENGIAGNPQIQVVAMADVLRPGLAGGRAALFPDPLAGATQAAIDARVTERAAFTKHCYLDYKVMLDQEKDNIDAVLIATPYKTHYQIVMDCLDADKYVFCEKTMADTYERCRNIVTKCHEKNKFVQCGHQRRYNPEYIRALRDMKETSIRRVGRVQYIEGQWHRNGDWRRPLPRVITDPKTLASVEYELTDAEKALIPDFQKLVNWRVYEEYSAGLISELATHHIEVVNWFMGAPPTRVRAEGGIDYWKDDRDTCDNVILVFDYQMKRGRRGFEVSNPKSGLQPLAPQKMLDPYTVRFTWTGTLQSSIKGESLLMLGDRGCYKLREQIDKGKKGCTFQAEPVKIWLDPKTMQETKDENIIAWIKATGQSAKYSRLIDQPVIDIEDELDPGLYDKSPDVRQFEAFAKHIKEGGVPRTNQMCGLMASICDIAAHEALIQQKTVEIDPAVYKFDFETPDPFVLDDSIA